MLNPWAYRHISHASKKINFDNKGQAIRISDQENQSSSKVCVNLEQVALVEV